jgi:tetratricopeptide (TPR) repeat protein
LFGPVTAQTVNVQQAPQIDVGLVLLVAESQGFLSPERARALEEQVARTQTDLERLRRDNPDWAAEIDTAIRAFNASDLAAARDAFARIDALIEERRVALLAEEATLRLEAARSKHAQATLFHPFEASKAEPLLTAAAELAQTKVWYWIDCGLARVELGRLADALRAFERGRTLARDGNAQRDLSVTLAYIGDVRVAQGDLPGALTSFDEALTIHRDLAARDPGNAGWARDVSVGLDRVGDVRVAQGDLPGARAAYDEGLTLRRDLAARDLGNAGWARDVWVSYWKLAQVDPGNAEAHWAEVVARIEDMAARGILAPVDVPYLETARANLVAAQAAR